MEIPNIGDNLQASMTSVGTKGVSVPGGCLHISSFSCVWIPAVCLIFVLHSKSLEEEAWSASSWLFICWEWRRKMLSVSGLWCFLLCNIGDWWVKAKISSLMACLKTSQGSQSLHPVSKKAFWWFTRLGELHWPLLASQSHPSQAFDLVVCVV